MGVRFVAEAQREFLDAISYFEEARGGDGSEAQGGSTARVQAFMDRAEREEKSISSTAPRHPGSFCLLWDPRLAQGTERGMVEDDFT